MPDVIQNAKMKNFIESSVSSDFGLTVDQVAEKCRTWGRFGAWLGGDLTRVKAILNIVKDNGVSPAFFASYERTEGVNSSWGWLNHTSVSGSPENDADSVSKWVAQQSRQNDAPAWIDFANYKDFVPQSVKSEGNAHFNGLPMGVIGRVVIAGTAAATWEVYYPNGLLASYNGVQNYGAPIGLMISYIEGMGGNISGGGGVDGSGTQLAVFPADIINVSQGEYGAFSHYAGSSQELAIDFVFPHTLYPLSAPFDSVVIDVLNEYAQINWKSTVPVMGANGVVYDSLVYTIIHDHNYHRWSVGDTIKKGEHIGNSGNAGYSTADHLHLQVMDSETHIYPTPVSVQLHIYDIFAVNGVDIINGNGYDWKTSDYQDGTGGGSDPGEDIPGQQNDIIPLLMSGALNGWH